MSAKRILVVDDSEVVREAMAVGLGKAGYAVTVAGSHDELLEVLPAGFDLILMDLNMPELFGDDVASVLRYSRGVHTPIYMLSSAQVDELARRVEEAGLDGYISKDDGLAAVLDRVRALLPA